MRTVASMAVYLGCAFMLLGCGSSPKPSKIPGGPAINLELQAEVVVLESPDVYRLPLERLRDGLELILLRQREHGPEKDGTPTVETGLGGDASPGVVVLTSDRKGMIRGALPAGVYRVLSLSAPARVHEGQANLARPAVGMRTLEGQGVLLTDGLGLTRRAEQLPEAMSWEVKEEEVLRPGKLVLKMRTRAWAEEKECVSQEVLLPGMEGSVYLFSEPMYAQLCIKTP
ncbi:MAG: hypothetical protein ACKO6N_07305 [Myxococcota bacterium]